MNLSATKKLIQRKEFARIDKGVVEMNRRENLAKQRRMDPIGREAGIPLTGQIAHDRYVIENRQKDIAKRDSNILRAGIAGTAAGAVLGRGRLPLKARLAAGALAGAGSVIGVRAVTHNTGRDVYGARQPWAARSEAAPAVIGAGAAGYGAYKILRKKFKMSDGRIEFAEKKKREMNPYVMAGLSGAASGAALGILPLLRRGVGLKTALRTAAGGAAAGGAIVGGGSLLGSSLLGDPDKKEGAAFTKRAAVGGAIVGGTLGIAGGLAARRIPAVRSQVKVLSKEWRPAMWIRKSGPVKAAAIGGAAGGAYGLGQGADEGQQVDSIRNLRKDLKRMHGFAAQDWRDARRESRSEAAKDYMTGGGVLAAGAGLGGGAGYAGWRAGKAANEAGAAARDVRKTTRSARMATAKITRASQWIKRQLTTFPTLRKMRGLEAGNEMIAFEKPKDKGRVGEAVGAIGAGAGALGAAAGLNVAAAGLARKNLYSRGNDFFSRYRSTRLDRFARRKGYYVTSSPVLPAGVGPLKSGAPQFNKILIRNGAPVHSVGLRKSYKQALQLDKDIPMKARGVFVRADNAADHVRAHEVGHVLQKPTMAKAMTKKLLLKSSMLGAGAALVGTGSQHDKTATGIAGLATAAALPTMVNEIDASAKGYRVMRKLGAGRVNSAKAFIGVPTYASVASIPALAWAARKMRQSKRERQEKRLEAGNEMIAFEKPFKGYNKKRHAKTGGLNDRFREQYNREHGSNLKRPVTTKPSKLKPGSKAAKRRASFCARMGGMPGPTSKDGKMTPKGAALKRWNCEARQARHEFNTALKAWSKMRRPPQLVASPMTKDVKNMLKDLQERHNRKRGWKYKVGQLAEVLPFERSFGVGFQTLQSPVMPVMPVMDERERLKRNLMVTGAVAAPVGGVTYAGWRSLKKSADAMRLEEDRRKLGQQLRAERKASMSVSGKGARGPIARKPLPVKPSMQPETLGRNQATNKAMVIGRRYEQEIKNVAVHSRGERKAMRAALAVLRTKYKFARKGQVHAFEIYARAADTGRAAGFYDYVQGKRLTRKNPITGQVEDVAVTLPAFIHSATRQAEKYNRSRKRGMGLVRDVREVSEGKKTKKREWEKSWFQNKVQAAAGAAALLAGGVVYRKGGLRSAPGWAKKFRAGTDMAISKAQTYRAKTEDRLGKILGLSARLKNSVRMLDVYQDYYNGALAQGWDLRDARGNSARVFSPKAKKRLRRQAEWHERKDNQRKLLIGAGVLGTAAAATGGVLIGRRFPVQKTRRIMKDNVIAGPWKKAGKKA
jgi:hypothetical protein